uniref:Uncharacterized protein n=1 Tax=Caenorhabditis japonica TaxID=281687 RepID=A0A8R1EU52_CAEJA
MVRILSIFLCLFLILATVSSSPIGENCYETKSCSMENCKPGYKEDK